MGAVNTNSVSLAVAEETSLGVLPVNPKAEYLEPNDIGDYGADITTVARNPISKDRQNKKGTITDLSSTVSVTGDTTASYLLRFLEGAMFSEFYSRPAFFQGEITASNADSGFVLDTPMSAALPAGTLLFIRGFVHGGNNGLKVAATGGDTATIAVEDASSIVDEVAGAGVSVYVVGYQFPEDDLSITAQGNIVSASVDFSMFDLQLGSAIYIGGLGATASFDNVNDTGLARVREVASGLLTIDKQQQQFVADAGTGKKIQLFFGWFLRNVPTDHDKFKEHSYTFEACYPGLGDNGEDGYEYSRGNYINTLELALPLNDKSEMTISTFGKDVDAITTVRESWTIGNPLFTEAYSTPSDFLRLRMQNVDETGLTTFFKEATLTINNNVSGENVLGKLGPAFVNYGNFDVSLSTSAVFTSPALTSKIRNNCTVTCDFCITNNDAGFYFDIPSMTLGDGAKDFAVNEKVKIALSSNAFGDSALGYTISQTFFPYLPSDKADACN